MIKEKFLEAAVKKFGEGGILNRKQIKEIASSIGESDARWFRKVSTKLVIINTNYPTIQIIKKLSMLFKQILLIMLLKIMQRLI